MSKFLVIGITGRVGGALARRLLQQGEQVRALVRDCAKASEWVDRGVELIDGDLNDAGAISRALHGVDAAFLMLPTSYTPSRDFQEAGVPIAACAKALRSAHLSRLVVLSSIGADKASGLGAITPLSLLERDLRDLPYPCVFIRAAAFYENFLYGLQVAQSGALPVLYASSTEKYPMVATADIGAEAAKQLTGPTWTGTRVIELGTMVSAQELAAALSGLLGREVAAVVLPREAWAPTLEQMGSPPGQTWAVEEIYDGVNSHWISFGAKGAERVESVTPARDVFAAARKSAQKN